jgi:hypothetical protein
VPKAPGNEVNDKIELSDVGIISQTSVSARKTSTFEFAGYVVETPLITTSTFSIQ